MAEPPPTNPVARPEEAEAKPDAERYARVLPGVARGRCAWGGEHLSPLQASTLWNDRAEPYHPVGLPAMPPDPPLSVHAAPALRI